MFGFSFLNPFLRGRQPLFANTNWEKTSAYGLGINAIYLNLQGREKHGAVRPGTEADALVDRLVKKLEDEKDPETGERILVRAYRKDEIYRGQCAGAAPDIILGYSRGYRASWGTILGTYEKHVVADNNDKWSGDHCMDVSGLSGVLLANRTITSDRPALIDLAPTILEEYGMKAPPGTEGKVILELKSVERVTPAHKKQVQTYLKLTGCKLGYLLNFNEALMKDGITRCVNGLEE